MAIKPEENEDIQQTNNAQSLVPQSEAQPDRWAADMIQPTERTTPEYVAPTMHIQELQSGRWIENSPAPQYIPEAQRPTYWSDPRRIGRYYHAIQSLPDESFIPEWIDKQGIESAYNYLKETRGGTWETWDNVTDDDPLNIIIKDMPVPPPNHMPLWEQEQIRRRLEYDKEYNPDKYQPDPGAREIGDVGVPASEWENLPEWKKAAQRILPVGQIGMQGFGGFVMGSFLSGGNPLVGAVGAGTMMGLSALTAKIMEKQARGEQLSVADKITLGGMMALNWPAEQLEKVIGTQAQILYSLVKPEKYGEIEEIFGSWENFVAAYQAGRVFYESLFSGQQVVDGRNVREEVKNFEGTLNDYLSTWIDSEGTVDPNRVIIGHDIYSNQDITTQVPDQQLANAWVMNQARDRILKGESPNEVYLSLAGQMGFMGSMRELMGNVLLDPLDMVGPISTYSLGKVGKLTGNKAMETAFTPAIGKNKDWAMGDWDNVIQNTQLYKSLVRTMPQEQAAQLSSFGKWLGGLTADGTPKDLVYKANDKNVFNYLFGLTPKARANYVLSTFVDGLNNLIAPEKDINVIESMVYKVANMTPEDAVKGAETPTLKINVGGEDMDVNMPSYFSSAESQYIPGAIKDSLPALHDLFDSYKVAEPQRAILNRVAEYMGIEPEQLLKKFHDAKPSEANHLYTQFLLKLQERAKTDTDAAKILNTLTKGDEFSQLNGSKLKKMADQFMGSDGIPFNEGVLKFKLLDVMEQSVGKWAVDWFGVKPDKLIFRMGNLVKRAQGALLLGFNPSYFFNNTIDNMIKLAWDGLLGLDKMANNNAFLKDFGVMPTRLMQAAGAMDVGGIDTARLSMFGMEGRAIGEDIRAASRTTGTVQMADDLMRKGDKYMVAAKYSQEMEKWSSQHAMVRGLQEYWNRVWQPGKGFSKVPDDLKLMLEAVEPGLSKKVEKLIARGRSKQQVEDAIFGRLQRRQSIRDVVDPDTLDMLDHLGITDEIDARLKNATTPEDIYSAIDDAKNMLIDRANEQIIRNLEKMTNDAALKTGVEGYQGVLDMVDNLEQVNADFWLVHMDNMQKLFEEVSGKKGKFRSAIWTSGRRQASYNWNTHNNIIGSKYLGIFRGLGMDNASPEYVNVGKLILDKRRIWDEFFRTSDDLYQRFDIEGEKMTDVERAELWRNINEEMNLNYIDAVMREDDVVNKLNDAFIVQYAKQFQNKGQQAILEARNWRSSVQNERRKMIQAQVLWRNGTLPDDVLKWGDLLPDDMKAAITKLNQGKPLHTLSRAVRDKISPKFWNDIYRQFVRDIAQSSTANAPGMVKAADISPDIEPELPEMPKPEMPKQTKAEAKHNTDVWKVISEKKPELAGVDENGMIIPDGKLDVIKYVLKWSPDARGKMRANADSKLHFTDIDVNDIENAIALEQDWLKRQMELPLDDPKRIVDEQGNVIKKKPEPTQVDDPFKAERERSRRTTDETTETEQKNIDNQTGYIIPEKLQGNEGFTTRLGIGNKETFEITTQDGSKLTGYINNQDFPGKKSLDTRGEIFYVEVTKGNRNKGTGTNLSIEAIRLMQANGTKTVNIDAVTPEGRRLVQRLIDKNIIDPEPVNVSSSGKNEYKIIDSIETQPATEQPDLVQSEAERIAQYVAEQKAKRQAEYQAQIDEVQRLIDEKNSAYELSKDPTEREQLRNEVSQLTQQRQELLNKKSDDLIPMDQQTIPQTKPYEFYPESHKLADIEDEFIQASVRLSLEQMLGDVGMRNIIMPDGSRVTEAGGLDWYKNWYYTNERSGSKEAKSWNASINSRTKSAINHLINGTESTSPEIVSFQERILQEAFTLAADNDIYTAWKTGQYESAYRLYNQIADSADDARMLELLHGDEQIYDTLIDYWVRGIEEEGRIDISPLSDEWQVPGNQLTAAPRFTPEQQALIDARREVLDTYQTLEDNLAEMQRNLPQPRMGKEATERVWYEILEARGEADQFENLRVVTEGVANAWVKQNPGKTVDDYYMTQYWGRGGTSMEFDPTDILPQDYLQQVGVRNDWGWWAVDTRGTQIRYDRAFDALNKALRDKGFNYDDIAYLFRQAEKGNLENARVKDQLVFLTDMQRNDLWVLGNEYQQAKHFNNMHKFMEKKGLTEFTHKDLLEFLGNKRNYEPLYQTAVQQTIQIPDRIKNYARMLLRSTDNEILFALYDFDTRLEKLQLLTALNQQDPVRAKSIFDQAMQDRSKYLWQEGNINTPEFRNFFKNSAVVDESGNPIKVAHGTPKGGFDQFEWTHKKNQQLGFGTHFTENKIFAEGYAKGELKIGGKKTTKGQVIEGYLNIEKPLFADTIIKQGDPEWELAVKLANGEKKLIQRYSGGRDENGLYGVYLQRVIDGTSPQRAEKIIQEFGYDGIRYEAEYTKWTGAGQSLEDRDISWVIFKPEQFKSVDNVGTFNPDDPRFMYQGERGLTRYLDDGLTVSHVFDGGDMTTIVHEVVHVFTPHMSVEHSNVFRDWLKKEYKMDLPEGWHKDPVAHREASELLAKGFERYLADGKAPTAKLKQVFESFKRYMLEIYKAITGSDIDIKLNDDVRKVFDEWVSGEKVVEETLSNFGKIKQGSTKAGNPIQIVPIVKRLEYEAFKQYRDLAKKYGGWYDKNNTAFSFRTEEGAQNFLKDFIGAADETAEVIPVKESPKVDTARAKAEKQANKLFELADKLEENAQKVYSADRLENTGRRARMAESARASANQDIFIARTMRNIAQSIADGESVHLNGITSKTHIQLLDSMLNSAKVARDRAVYNQKNTYYSTETSYARNPTIEDLDYIEYPYLIMRGNFVRDMEKALKGKRGVKADLNKLNRFYDTDFARVYDHVYPEVIASYTKLKKLMGKEANYWSDGLETYNRIKKMGINNKTELIEAMKEFMTVLGEGIKPDKVKEMERALLGVDIPGYFPTPKELALQLVDDADIQPGMKVLEPSAGKGNIADAIKERVKEIDLDVIEYNYSLSSILKEKGYNVIGNDIFDATGTYDRIVMNPPFEKFQDIDHVMKAYELLNPGGRIVSIMGAGTFFRNDAKAVQFRNWLDGVGFYEPLPEGSFLKAERSTGVNTYKVIIDKPVGVTPEMETIKPTAIEPTIETIDTPSNIFTPKPRQQGLPEGYIVKPGKYLAEGKYAVFDSDNKMVTNYFDTQQDAINEFARVQEGWKVANQRAIKESNTWKQLVEDVTKLKEDDITLLVGENNRKLEDYASILRRELGQTNTRGALKKITEYLKDKLKGKTRVNSWGDTVYPREEVIKAFAEYPDLQKKYYNQGSLIEGESPAWELQSQQAELQTFKPQDQSGQDTLFDTREQLPTIQARHAEGGAEGTPLFSESADQSYKQPVWKNLTEEQKRFIARSGDGYLQTANDFVDSYLKEMPDTLLTKENLLEMHAGMIDDAKKLGLLPKEGAPLFGEQVGSTTSGIVKQSEILKTTEINPKRIEELLGNTDNTLEWSVEDGGTVRARWIKAKKGNGVYTRRMKVVVQKADGNYKLYEELKAGTGKLTVVSSGKNGLLFQSAAQPGSPEFERWFGDSKVVDENGKPLVVYHGTRSKTEIDYFEPSLIGTQTDEGWMGKGFYFTHDPDVANVYSGNRTVYPVYLRIENPFDFSKVDNFARFIKEKGGAAEFTKWAKSQGYDGAKMWSQYVVFEPEQIKSVFNRGTFDPNDPRMLYQSAATPPKETAAQGAPFGTADQLVNPPFDEMLFEGMIKNVLPALDDATMKLMDNNVPEKGSIYDRLPDDAKRRLKQYAGQVYSDMSSSKMGAIKYAEARRAFSLLDYSRRTGFDSIAGIFMPYQFWYTRSAINWLLRIMADPKILADYFRLTTFAQDAEDREGYPQRLKGKIGIPVPFLPDWMGKTVYIDPMRKIFNFADMARPFTQLAEQNNMLNKKTVSKIQQMIEDGSITEEEAQQAIETQSGEVWDNAMIEARAETDLEIKNPLDFAFALASPSLPLSIAYNYASGNKDRISQLPITRTFQALTSMAGIGGPRGVNIEAPFRRGFGLNEVDQYEDYRVNRELSNMVADGLVDYQTAIMAMMERKGQVFEEAQSRVATQMNTRTFLSSVGLDFFPEGEQEMRSIANEYGKALEAYYEDGQEDALTLFWDEYPEYEARKASLQQDPNEMMRQFLRSRIWEAWGEMSGYEKQQVVQGFGSTFEDSFLNKETRNYDDISTETYVAWAKTLGQRVPEQVAGIPEIPGATIPDAVSTKLMNFTEQRDSQWPGISETLSELYDLPANQQQAYRDSHPEIEEYQQWRYRYIVDNPEVISYMTGESSELYGLPDHIQYAVYQYRVEVADNFPNIYDTQTAYFNIQNTNQKKNYLKQHPELVAYWDFRREYAAAYPQAAPYVLSEESLAKSILGEDRSVSTSTSGSGSMVQPVDTTQFDDALLRLLAGYFYANRDLTPGARAELTRLWEKAGKPAGSVDNWLNAYVWPQLKK